MEPKSGRKPINLLSEYLTFWIRKNSEEALPFDSFENLYPRRVAQKTVERWIFNCNYLHSRIGDIFYDRDLFPSNDGDRTALINSIDASFKSISDNTPLDLRSKPDEAIVYELSRDWPPFSENSRNTLDRFLHMLESFKQQNRLFCAAHQDALKSAAEEIRQEADWYASLRKSSDMYARSLATRCRTLLPVWCAKEINPLVTLLIWNDEDAIEQLVDELSESFLAQRQNNDESVAFWREATLRAQATYMDNIDDDTDLAGFSVPKIGNLLTAEGFSLDHDDTFQVLPRWLLGKSRLIWNIVICAILGPDEAIGSAGCSKSPTVESTHHATPSIDACHLTGEVLLRRRFRSGRIETIERLLLDHICSPGLWKIIGARYDPYAPLPNSDYRAQFTSLGASFVASETRDASGALIEGKGDSRFQLELSLRLDTHNRITIIARDLNSKNGTCILRNTHNGCICYAFPGRRHLTARDWAERLDLPEDRIYLVDELPLERGDVIELADSCFELI